MYHEKERAPDDRKYTANSVRWQVCALTFFLIWANFMEGKVHVVGRETRKHWREIGEQIMAVQKLGLVSPQFLRGYFPLANVCFSLDGLSERGTATEYR